MPVTRLSAGQTIIPRHSTHCKRVVRPCIVSSSSSSSSTRSIKDQWKLFKCGRVPRLRPSEKFPFPLRSVRFKKRRQARISVVDFAIESSRKVGHFSSFLFKKRTAHVSSPWIASKRVRTKLSSLLSCAIARYAKPELVLPCTNSRILAVERHARRKKNNFFFYGN